MNAHWLHSQGWRRRLLAALYGALATLALPPFFILPLLIPAFSGLFLLVLHAKSKRQAFLDGWWWGLGHFATGLYWICISLFVEPEKFAWLTPFALFGLPSIVAIYIGLVTLALRAVTTPPAPTRALVAFPPLWIAAEYARAHLFTGFPWNLIGYSLNATTATLQAASVWGIYGQSWLVVQLATLPALVLLSAPKARALNVLGLIALCLVTGWGSWRLAAHPTEYTPFTIRIVQANVAQALKFAPETMLQGLKKHVTLTQEDGLDKVNMVIWPETAVPYLLQKDSRLIHDMGRILLPNTLLFTGGMHGEGNEKDWKAWNAGFVINSKGEMPAFYNKHHLVPFGEFIPFRTILPIEAIAAGMGDFERGAGPQTLNVENAPPFSPLICYEAIFPDEAIDPHTRPQWLINITNDAWFGLSTGPFQHMEMARARAVEQGIPLVRAANTGISIVTDSYGRILKYLPTGTEGIIDSALPTPAQ